MWKSLWGFRSVKIYLTQTFVASSWPSAWQHFRQFCSNEGSDVRLKGFSSSHELQMRFTENPKSLHSSGVNSARVIWIKVKKMERKGEIYIFQSISNSSPNRLMNVLGPSLFSVLFDRGWKKISNKHQCKPLNTVSQSGKTVSLLFEQEIRREWWTNPDQEGAHVGNVMAQFVEARPSSRAMKAVCQLHSEWDKSFSVWSYKYKKIGKNVLNTEVSAVSDSNQW